MAAQPVEHRRGQFGNGIVDTEIAAEEPHPGADAVAAIADGAMHHAGLFQCLQDAQQGRFRQPGVAMQVLQAGGGTVLQGLQHIEAAGECADGFDLRQGYGGHGPRLHQVKRRSIGLCCRRPDG